MCIRCGFRTGAVRLRIEERKADQWQPMETAPTDGSFVRIMLKDGSDIVAHYHGTYHGWVDWQERSPLIRHNVHCHGWQAIDQATARALPLRRKK